MTVKFEEQDVLVVTIDDTAPSTIPAEWSGNNGREAHEGGLGLGIVRRIASDVVFEPTKSGNRAMLEFLAEYPDCSRCHHRTDIPASTTLCTTAGDQSRSTCCANGRGRSV